VLGVSMSVQRQENDRSCICVRCIDVCSKRGQWSVMYMC
jgi:polyferredoxin